MAFIRHTRSSEQVALEAEHLVGRAAGCSLQLPDSHVSSRHAVFRWHGDHWLIRDLGSRNGTFVDGQRMASGTASRVTKGAHLGFGSELDLWELVDDERPRVMALPLKAGEPMHAEDSEIFGLPSATEPLLTIYRASDGLWRLETAEQAARILTHGEIFEVAGAPWRFSCPPPMAPSITEERAQDSKSVHLVFSVSADEEHVRLSARCGEIQIDLGTRNHNYLLLQLARQRLLDRAEGLPSTAAGWYYQDELAKRLRIDTSQLNLDIFRIRRHIAGKGIPNAVNLIERRTGTRQLRIGTDELVVVVE